MATRNSVLAKLNVSDYNPRSEEEIRSLAENLYKAQLTSALSQAENSYNTERNALENQRAGINTSYDRQYAKQKEANAQSIAAADRAAVGRGMQRSSYNMQNLNRLRASGDQTLNEIEENRTNALGSIDSQQTVLASNYANSQNAANASYESNVLAKIQELQDTEYQRQEAARQSNNQTLLSWAGLLRGSSGGRSAPKKPKDTTKDSKPTVTVNPPDLNNNLIGGLGVNVIKKK